MLILPILGAQPGPDFRLTATPHALAAATFVAVGPASIQVTRRLADLWPLPDETPVVAHWHGQWRTDGFAMTVGELRRLAALPPK